MYTSLIVDILRESLMIVMLISGGLTIIPLVVSLIISIFQSATQIQEQALTFLPKFFLIFLALLFAGPYIVSRLSNLFLMVLELISMTIGA